MVNVFHSTYRYIDPSHHNSENCHLPWFFHQSCLSWLSGQWPAQATLRGKSWNETIFKIIVGRINVLSICNVLYSYFFTMQKKILYLLFEKIYHGGKFNDTLHTNSVAFDSDIYRYNWANPSCCNYFTHHILGDWNGSGSFKLCK